MEETRYTLNGGLLILKPDTLAMVATDGHRLALAETDQKLSGLNGEVKVLIPKKAMDEVEKLSSVAGSEAQMDFSKDESHLFFQAGHRLLISRILTGQFPNYEAVLPRDNSKSVVLERAELNDAIRRVSQLADQRSHAVKLAVSKEGIEISASSPEYGEARETIDKEYQGDPISIGFNSSYVLDFLSASADGPISIELKDEQRDGQMRPLADETYRYCYILMPMRPDLPQENTNQMVVLLFRSEPQRPGILCELEGLAGSRGRAISIRNESLYCEAELVSAAERNGRSVILSAALSIAKFLQIARPQGMRLKLARARVQALCKPWRNEPAEMRQGNSSPS
jgi:hypothetical protein